MISFVYFDVGGVLIKDFSASNKWDELQRLSGLNDQNQIIAKQIWQKYDDELCISFDVDKLIPILAKELNLTFDPEFSILHETIRLFEPNQSIWPILEKIGNKVPIGLLTNMWPRMFKMLHAEGMMPNIKWREVIDSTIAGYQKPQPEIYAIAQEKARVPPDQILFIDNSLDNVEAAKKRGWHAFWYNSSNYEDSSQKLNQYLKNKITRNQS